MFWFAVVAKKDKLLFDELVGAYDELCRIKHVC